MPELVNVPAAISMVVAPCEVGVNVAVYTVLDVAEKLLKAPLVTVISPTAKSVVASLLVKVEITVLLKYSILILWNKWQNLWLDVYLVIL